MKNLTKASSLCNGKSRSAAGARCVCASPHLVRVREFRYTWVGETSAEACAMARRGIAGNNFKD